MHTIGQFVIDKKGSHVCAANAAPGDFGLCRDDENDNGGQQQAAKRRCLPVALWTSAGGDCCWPEDRRMGRMHDGQARRARTRTDIDRRAAWRDAPAVPE